MMVVVASNRQLLQKFQEDLACIQAHTLFSNIQQADAVDFNAKKKDSGHQSALRMLV